MEVKEKTKEEVYQRLAILEDGGLITSRVSASCRQVVELVLAEKPDVNRERFGMFVTHLAMAMQRIRDGEEEMPMDSQVLESVKQSGVYPRAEAFSRVIFPLCCVEFTQTEQDFLRVHLCNLFS